MAILILEGRTILGHTLTRCLDTESINRNALEKALDKFLDKVFGTKVHQAKTYLSVMVNHHSEFNKMEAFSRMKALAPYHFQSNFKIIRQTNHYNENPITEGKVTLRIDLSEGHCLSTRVSLAASFWPEVSKHMISESTYKNMVADLVTFSELSRKSDLDIPLSIREKIRFNEVSKQYDLQKNPLYFDIYQRIAPIEYTFDRDDYAKRLLTDALDPTIGFYDRSTFSLMLRKLLVRKDSIAMDEIEGIINSAAEKVSSQPSYAIPG